MSDNATGGSERFRCEDCDSEQGPPSHTRCEECGGLVREYLQMQSPVYQVHIPGIGILWYGPDDYEGAYQNATGYRTDDEGDDLTDELEEKIHLVDFDGVAEVPVADI